MIEIRNLSKSFGSLQVLKKIDATIEKGEVISIIGPSGTGKSTLLRCINLLEHPDGGEIVIDGENILKHGAKVTKVRQKMGMVFQSFNLFPHMTVLENLTVGPVKLLKREKKQAEVRGMELLDMVGLADKRNSLPEELSGGQQQRVAIARCLSMDPEIILFDEPTSALDPTMISEVLSVIRRLARDGMTMAIVTHEMDFARDVSNRVFYMNEGIIYESGPPEQIFDAPQKKNTISFIHRLRNYLFHIDSRSYDVYKMNGEIEQFCEKFFFSKKMTYHTLLAVEETLALYFSNAEHHEITLELTYSEKNGELQLLFTDRNNLGNFLDSAEVEDQIGISLLKGIVHDIKWLRAGGENRLTMTLNETGR